jgi:hypothetical protein
LTKSIRFLLSAAVGVCALAFAGTAFAAYEPSLLVAGTTHNLGASGPVVIGVGQDDNDDATAMGTIYSPVGYRVTLGQAPNTQLGTFSGVVKVGALGGARVNVEGTVRADVPANYVSNSCAPGAHEAVWLIEFSVSGNAFRVPVYVDRITAGPEAAYASARMIVCLASPYVAPPQGSAQGASVIIAAFSIRSVFGNPSRRGSHAWNGVFTPYTPGTATPNPTNATQSTSYVRLPVQLSISAKRQRVKKRTFARVTACLTEAGTALRGITVNVLSSRTPGGKTARVARGRTNARGCVTTRVRVKIKTIYLRASVSVSPRAAAGCSPTSGLAPRCSSPSIAPAFDLFSRTTLRVRR